MILWINEFSIFQELAYPIKNFFYFKYKNQINVTNSSILIIFFFIET